MTNKKKKQNSGDYIKKKDLLEDQVIDEVAPEERINEPEDYEDTPVDDEQLRD